MSSVPGQAIPPTGGGQIGSEPNRPNSRARRTSPMVLVLEDGEHIEGCIEWYDRNTLKVRGRQKTLVYKAAIKYMYKFAENGQ